MERMMSFVGLLVLLGVCFLLCKNKKRIDKRVILWGLGLQVIFAILVLGIPRLGVPGLLRFAFGFLNDLVMKILAFSDEGATFLFGSLVDSTQNWGFIFAFRILPTIIFFSSLIAILYHLKILPKVVTAIAWVIRKFMRASGAESLSTAANIFLGQTEAPLMVKPYLAAMTRSELFCVMVGGFSNVAGGVMAAYVAILHDRFPDIAGHLLTVSVMSAPATLLVAKLMMPETEEVQSDKATETEAVVDANVIEAATRGASEGLGLALNVAAMMLVFTALMAMVNFGVSGVGSMVGVELSLAKLFGWVFSPLAFLLGVPWGESNMVGTLIGQKIVLNEFVAYVEMGKIASQLSDRSVLIASYALCGFANFASIGIQVGGIGAMAPNRRGDLARLGLKAMIGGNIATFISTCIVGILL